MSMDVHPKNQKQVHYLNPMYTFYVQKTKETRTISVATAPETPVDKNSIDPNRFLVISSLLQTNVAMSQHKTTTF